MKERPILFSGPMVRAILAGRKSQTRRVVKPQPLLEQSPTGPMWGHEKLGGLFAESVFGGCAAALLRCPYGQPGDLLWVKEAIYHAFAAIAPDDGSDIARFAADDALTKLDRWPWRRDRLPGMFMPRWASRITLEVVSVRVERLNDISEEDAKAEGVEFLPCRYVGRCNSGRCPGHQYKPAFEALWDSINAKRAPWSSNPWVWAVEFKRCAQ